MSSAHNQYRSASIPDHTVVSSDQWLDARLKLLKQKKEFFKSLNK